MASACPMYYKSRSLIALVDTLLRPADWLCSVLMCCVCAGKGVAQRDIKPGNVLLFHQEINGRSTLALKLADFGLAKRFDVSEGKSLVRHRSDYADALSSHVLFGWCIPDTETYRRPARRRQDFAVAPPCAMSSERER
jgi:serine/threonine protein kinase